MNNKNRNFTNTKRESNLNISHIVMQEQKDPLEVYHDASIEKLNMRETNMEFTVKKRKYSASWHFISRIERLLVMKKKIGKSSKENFCFSFHLIFFQITWQWQEENYNNEWLSLDELNASLIQGKKIQFLKCK